jgi:hypothetical protein
MRLFPATEEVDCVVRLSACDDDWSAHVSFDDEIVLDAGDRVCVLGAPLQAPANGVAWLRRRARIERAGVVRRVLTMMFGDFNALALIDD